MLQDHRHKHRRGGSLYGAFAYGSVVLTCYANFFVNQRYYASAAMVPVVFALGAVYATLGILTRAASEGRERARATYYVLQCVILTAILFLSPSRGFMGILVLPMVSQSVFDLRPWPASLATVYLFTITIAVWAIPFGWSGARTAILNYSTAFAFTIAFSVVTRQALNARKREAALRQQVEAVNQELRDHAAQAEELATVRERNRVAREIHDGVGHYLTVVKTQLDAADALLPAQPDAARATIRKAAKLAADALDDVRRSVGSLRTDAARVPLPDSLRALTAESGLPVAIHVEGAVRPLPAAVEHALFRSAQEALTNVRKHAGATAATLVLDFQRAGLVALAVTDNGCGAKTTAPAGFGLRGIRERIELLGGRMETGLAREGGFRVNVEVPA
jgi:signal transduction histidine kinase